MTAATCVCRRALVNIAGVCVRCGLVKLTIRAKVNPLRSAERDAA